MLNKAILVLSALTIFHSAAMAASWTSYTNSDAVRQIVSRQDEIWAATSGGAVSYNLDDGEFFKLTNTDGLGGIDLRCVESDTSGSLWFGAYNGWLSRISFPLNIRNFAIRDSSGLIGRAVAIFDLKIDGDRLWLASDLGISKFLIYTNGGEIRDTARRLGNIPDMEDAVCAEVIGQNLWVGTAHGVAFIDKDNANIQYFGNWRSFVAGQNGLANADVRTILENNDTVLVGTASGIYALPPGDTIWQSFGLTGSVVSNLFRSDTLLLAATNTGLFGYGIGGWSIYNSSGLPGGLATDFILIPDGSLWAGTPASGLAEYTSSSWTLHSIPGPASNIFGRMAIDSSGGLWMTHAWSGLTSLGMSRLAGDQWQTFKKTIPGNDFITAGPIPNILDNDQVDVSVSPDGQVWISSYGGGLYRYNLIDQSWFRWNYTNSPMYGVAGGHHYWVANGVTADHDGNIWVAARESDSSLMMGVFAPYSQDSTWQLFRGDEIGLSAPVFGNMFLVDGDIVWFARGNGLSRLDHGGTPFDKNDDEWNANMNTLNIVDLELDNAGTLWLATASGLYFLLPYADSTEIFELPSEISGGVNAIEADGVGNLWVGTAAGLGVLRPDGDNPFSSRWSTYYTTGNSPLIDNEVNGIAIDIPTGVIYIGTANGLSVFDSGILPPTSDLSDMGAFPNPAVLSDGVDQIEFKRVPSSGTLIIYTTSGDKVAQIDLSRGNSWNLKNEDGKRIAGGIYFFHVKSGESSGTGKFAVIR
jgi:ligand-binding sensor domain-containing protein